MKTLILRIFPAILASGLLVSAVAQTAPPITADANDTNNNQDQSVVAPESDDAPQMPDEGAMSEPEAQTAPMDSAPTQDEDQSAAPTANVQPVAKHLATTSSNTITSSESMPTVFSAPTATGTNLDELRLNFRNVPLDMVLNYLSDAAGFIIVLDTPVHGTVSVISSHPMTRDEAVDLLNSVLDQNGYAAIRDGRTLTIVDKNDAKTRDIPVITGNDPSAIPRNDEIVTQIIPVRFVEAKQLVTDLSSFVSPQATIVANDAGNSIVITDTQANIRHLAEIINAIDNSAQGETEIRVFHLEHANPTDVASELGQIFPDNGTGNGQTQSPIRFGGGGRGGGPGGFFARMMAANSAGASSQNSAIQKQSQVIAVADLRTSSVIVTASKDLMEQISGMMDQLDVSSTRDQKVYVFHMNNGDPQQAAQVLQGMFQSSSSTSSSSSQNSALMTREQNNATSTGSSSSSSSSSGFGSGGSRAGGAGTSF